MRQTYTGRVPHSSDLDSMRIALLFCVGKWRSGRREEKEEDVAIVCIRIGKPIAAVSC
jgi:hypothetical protein